MHWTYLFCLIVKTVRSSYIKFPFFYYTLFCAIVKTIRSSYIKLPFFTTTFSTSSSKPSDHLSLNFHFLYCVIVKTIGSSSHLHVNNNNIEWCYFCLLFCSTTHDHTLISIHQLPSDHHHIFTLATTIQNDAIFSYFLQNQIRWDRLNNNVVLQSTLKSKARSSCLLKLQ